jgi:hypothetical protein
MTVVKKFTFLVAVNNSIQVGPLGFLVINVCNQGEYYETPCINFWIYWALNETTEWHLEQILKDAYFRKSLENIQNVRCLST